MEQWMYPFSYEGLRLLQDQQVLSSMRRRHIYTEPDNTESSETPSCQPATFAAPDCKLVDSKHGYKKPSDSSIISRLRGFGSLLVRRRLLAGNNLH
jgi:hypothetical protein